MSDANFDDELYAESNITSDEIFNIRLTIEPNGEGSYKIYRDGELYDERVITYEEAGENQ